VFAAHPPKTTAGPDLPAGIESDLAELRRLAAGCPRALTFLYRCAFLCATSSVASTSRDVWV